MEEDNRQVLSNFKNASNALATFFKQAGDTTIKTYHTGRNDAYKEIIEICQTKIINKSDININELIGLLNDRVTETESMIEKIKNA